MGINRTIDDFSTRVLQGPPLTASHSVPEAASYIRPHPYGAEDMPVAATSAVPEDASADLLASKKTSDHPHRDYTKSSVYSM